jgi:hypothetical protein
MLVITLHEKQVKLPKKSRVLPCLFNAFIIKSIVVILFRCACSIYRFLPICTNKPYDFIRNLHILFGANIKVLLFEKRIIYVVYNKKIRLNLSLNKKIMKIY